MTVLSFIKNRKISNFGKHTSGLKCVCMVALCSSTNQIKVIESFMPTLPEGLNRVTTPGILRKPWPMKQTKVITVSICDKIDTHRC